MFKAFRRAERVQLSRTATAWVEAVNSLNYLIPYEVVKTCFVLTLVGLNLFSIYKWDFIIKELCKIRALSGLVIKNALNCYSYNCNIISIFDKQKPKHIVHSNT